MSLSGGPIWRKAPLLLFRWPPIVGAIGASFVVLVVTASIGPLFTSSAAGGALRQEVRGLSLSSAGLTVRETTPLADFHVSRPDGSRELTNAAQLLLLRTDALDRAVDPIAHLGPVLPSVILGESSLGPPSDSIQVRPLARAGFESHIKILDQTGGPGFFVPKQVADELGAKVGDVLELSVETPTRVRIKGIYEDLGFAPPTAYWRPLNRYIYRLRPADAKPPALLLGDIPLVIDTGEASETFGVEIWEYPLQPKGLTLDDARASAREVNQVSAALLDESTDLGSIFSPPEGSSLPNFLQLEVRTLLPNLVDSADEIVVGIESPVQVLVLTGALVALLLITVSAHYMVQKRGVEFRLLHSRGVTDVWIGARAMLESAIPVLLAAIVGAAGTWALVAAFGPGPLDEEALRSAAITTAGAVCLGIAALGIGTSIAARRQASIETGATGAFGRAPWEVLLLIGAGLTLYLINRRGAISSEGSRSGRVDLLLVVFPMLGIAGGALFTVKAALAYLESIRAATARSGTALYLAIRRIVSARRSVALLIGAASVAVGIFIYSTALLASVRATTYAKTHVFTGSDVSVIVSNTDLPPIDVPHTVVSTTDGDIGDTAVTVMGIDPKTFEAGAYWDETFSETNLRSLVDAIDVTGSQRLPAIAVGENLAPTSVSIRGHEIPVQVVGKADTWPGKLEDMPMIVTAYPALAERASEGGFQLDRLTLWAKGPIDKVKAALQEAGVDTQLAISTRDVGETAKLLSISWTFGLLRILGVVAGLLAVVGMLLYVAARRRTRLVSYLLGKRMGLQASSHRISLLIELASMLASSLLLGAVLGTFAARLVYIGLDLLPQVPPAPLFRIPSTEVIATALFFAGAALLGAVIIQRASDRANPGEVMRLAD